MRTDTMIETAYRYRLFNSDGKKISTGGATTTKKEAVRQAHVAIGFCADDSPYCEIQQRPPCQSKFRTIDFV
jgi:hypothetical protein